METEDDEEEGKFFLFVLSFREVIKIYEDDPSGVSRAPGAKRGHDSIELSHGRRSRSIFLIAKVGRARARA